MDINQLSGLLVSFDKRLRPRSTRGGFSLFSSLDIELSTAVRLSEPPNIIMLDPDLNLERCVRTPDRPSSTTPPPSFARSFGTKFLALRGFALRGAGEADPPPVGLRPLPGAAPHLLQLLPSETYRPHMLLGMRLLRR